MLEAKNVNFWSAIAFTAGLLAGLFFDQMRHVMGLA